MVSCASSGQATSIGYIGNIVDLWERLVERDVYVDRGSDQPVSTIPGKADITLQELNLRTLFSTYSEIKTEVRSTLNRHVNAVNQMVANGMHFWDYGTHSCPNRVELCRYIESGWVIQVSILC